MTHIPEGHLSHWKMAASLSDPGTLARGVQGEWLSSELGDGLKGNFPERVGGQAAWKDGKGEGELGESCFSNPQPDSPPSPPRPPVSKSIDLESNLITEI